MDLARRYLERAAGAQALVEWTGRGGQQAPAGSGPEVAWWQARHDRFFVRFASVDGGAPRRGWATVRLNLGTGIYRFRAWLQPLEEGGVWEVLPDRRISVEQARSGIRAPFRVSLHLQVPGVAEDIAGASRDLSTSGIGFESGIDLPVGTSLRIAAAAQGPLWEQGLPARLVRRTPERDGEMFTYGARFVDLDAEARQELTALVAELLRSGSTG
jgi:hypothetical protein